VSRQQRCLAANMEAVGVSLLAIQRTSQELPKAAKAACQRLPSRSLRQLLRERCYVGSDSGVPDYCVPPSLSPTVSASPMA
jgi:hypothetical protein